VTIVPTAIKTDSNPSLSFSLPQTHLCLRLCAYLSHWPEWKFFGVWRIEYEGKMMDISLTLSLSVARIEVL
jgi:hypothetical protein